MASVKCMLLLVIVAMTTVANCSPVPGGWGHGGHHEHIRIHVPYHVHTVHHHHVKKVHIPIIKKVFVPVHHDHHDHHDHHHEIADFGHDGGWW